MSTFDTKKTTRELTKQIPTLRYSLESRLSAYTTVKIGGPAELLLEVKSTEDLLCVAQYSQRAQIPLTILGWGANTLISDEGIRGITIINKSNGFKIVSESAQFNQTMTTISSRWKEVQEKNDDFFSYFTGQEIPVIVEFDSGTPLPSAINQMLSRGLIGLEWFSRIPATIGGAIYNNIHGGTHFISDQLHSVSILTEAGIRQEVLPTDLEFAYDYSKFHHTNDVIVSAQLFLFRGNVEAAKKATIAWAQKKQHQPQKSLGCVFQNITATDQQKLDLPTSSVGYLIDKKLKLAGFQIGGAQVSKHHAAFIENIGSASAADYLAVIRHVQHRAQTTFGIFLKPEIFFLGFNPNEIRDITVE